MMPLPIAALLALAASAQAQTPPEPTLPIRVGDAAISGRVMARENQAPIARALITLTSPDQKALLVAETDDSGHYTFDRIAPGEYRVSAKHQDYVGMIFDPPDERPTSLIYGGVVALAPGQRRTDIHFALARGGSITGRVSSEDGRPLKGARVSVLGTPGVMNSGSLVSGTTNERGEYLLTNLAQGDYQVLAMWFDTNDRNPTGTNTRTTYFPGTVNLREAGNVRVTTGELSRGIDIIIPLSELARIQGQIVRSGSGGRIEAYVLGEGAFVHTVPVSEDGTFSTPRLKTGRYTLVARAQSDADVEATTLTVDLTGEMTDIVVPLSATAAVSGRVMYDDGTAVTESFQVAAVLAASGKEIDPLRRDRVDVGPDGTFSLKGLFGERLLRIIGLWDGGRLDRVMVGKATVTSLTMQPAQDVSDVVIVLTRR